MPSRRRIPRIGGQEVISPGEMGAAAPEPRVCRLEQAVGVDAACPESACPFWEPGGAVLDGRCVLEGLDFSRDGDVARWLLGLRGRLEGASDA
jgi:hypothetical protein